MLTSSLFLGPRVARRGSHERGHGDKDIMVFREVFLLHVPPAGVASLRQLGRHMFETLLDVPLDGPPEAPVAAQARALAEDLRVSGRELARLGSARERGGLTVEEMSLAMKVESWAREVAELVRAIEAAVGNAGRER